MEKIKELAKKFLTRDIILYVIFGVLTTLVNIGSFYVMTSILKWNEDLSNFIAIALAILFAYFTNKDWVFHSKAKGFKEKFSEFLKFIAGRAVTMVIEFGGCFILFRTPIPPIISKCGINVIIVILNFLISKFYTFKDKKDTKIEEENNNENIEKSTMEK